MARRLPTGDTAKCHSALRDAKFPELAGRFLQCCIGFLIRCFFDSGFTLIYLDLLGF